MKGDVVVGVPKKYHGLRSLDGGDLLRDRLVRLVYVDEAGISNRHDEPFTVVADVVVHADNDLAGC